MHEWLYTTPLTSAQNKIIGLGIGSLITVVDCRHYPYLTWGVMTELLAKLTVEGSMDFAFTATDTLITQPIAAATYTTPYSLPAPFNNTGWVMLNRPFIRLRLVETSVADHAYTRFYAKLW